MELQERFDLLEASGQVGPAAVSAAKLVLAGVEEFLGRSLDGETGAMIATHLALAMERLVQGEPLAEVPDVALEEAREYAREWDRAEALLSAASTSLGRQVPLPEVVYLTIHLRSLGETE